MTTPTPPALTKDEIQAIRDKSCDGLLHVHGVMGRIVLTVSERDALCDAAERAETLQAQLVDAQFNVSQREDDINALEMERDALSAQLAELQQLRERAESDADEAIRGQLAAVKRADAAEAQLTEITRERDAERQRWMDARARELKAEASLAPLRAVVQAAKRVAETYWGGDVAKANRLEALRQAIAALPADPSAPTP